MNVEQRHPPGRIVFLLLVLTLLACDSNPVRMIRNTGPSTPTLEFADDFFPLTVGATWSYELADLLNGGTPDTLTYIIREQSTVGDIQGVLRSAFSPRSGETLITFALIDDSIRSWVAGRWVVQSPESFLPNRLAGDTLEVQIDSGARTTLTLLRTDTSLTVPAGRYDNVFLVERGSDYTATGQLFARVHYGFKIGVGRVFEDHLSLLTTTGDTLAHYQLRLLETNLKGQDAG